MAIEKKSLISKSTGSTKTNVKAASPAPASKLQTTVRLAKNVALAKQLRVAKAAQLAKMAVTKKFV